MSKRILKDYIVATSRDMILNFCSQGYELYGYPTIQGDITTNYSFAQVLVKYETEKDSTSVKSDTMIVETKESKTFWSKPDDVPIGALIKTHLYGGGITTIIRTETNVITLCDGHIGYGKELKDYKWRFPHELRKSDWKDCTIESLEKYRQ